MLTGNNKPAAIAKPEMVGCYVKQLPCTPGNNN